MTETLRQAVLDETADLRGLDHWELAARLRRLRRLAETQRDSGRVEHGVAFYFKQAAAVKSEQEPWLVEADGSKWVWRQFPGDHRAPVLWEAGQAVEVGTGSDVQQLGLWE